jgi:hypothetical protein
MQKFHLRPKERITAAIPGDILLQCSVCRAPLSRLEICVHTSAVVVVGWLTMASTNGGGVARFRQKNDRHWLANVLLRLNEVAIIAAGMTTKRRGARLNAFTIVVFSCNAPWTRHG